MEKQTEFFIYNESGLISHEELEFFAKKLSEKSMLNLTIKFKEDIDNESTIFMKIRIGKSEFTIYDYGYVMKFEGSIMTGIIFLHEIDRSLGNEIEFYVRPTATIENKQEFLYSRGARLTAIADFLDKLFNNNNYSEVLYWL